MSSLAFSLLLFGVAFFVFFAIVRGITLSQLAWTAFCTYFLGWKGRLLTAWTTWLLKQRATRFERELEREGRAIDKQLAKWAKQDAKKRKQDAKKDGHLWFTEAKRKKIFKAPGKYAVGKPVTWPAKRRQKPKPICAVAGVAVAGV